MLNKLALITALALALTGCNSQKPATPAPITQAQPPATLRPAIAPPPFRVFHTTDTSITLVTKPNATDDEITSLIWQLRDAAHTHSLDKLKINQQLVDARKPTRLVPHLPRPQMRPRKVRRRPPPLRPQLPRSRRLHLRRRPRQPPMGQRPTHPRRRPRNKTL